MEEGFAMIVRIKFAKTGFMKFVGHLDLMRTFQKIFRRSKIPIEYSKGFNPHQVFSIAAPLAVGVTSDGEYLDMKISPESYDMNLLVEQINSCCPEGIKILTAREVVDKKAAMSLVQACKYEITFEDEEQYKAFIQPTLHSFLEQEEIIVKKKNKKGRINEKDLKEGVLSYEINNEKLVITLATGSVLNVKPDLLIGAYIKGIKESSEVIGKMEEDVFYYRVHRIETYANINTPYKNLFLELV